MTLDDKNVQLVYTLIMTGQDTKDLGQRLTVEEVAELLKVSKRTVLREIKRGNLHAQKAGRRYLFTQKEIDRYFQKDIVEPEKAIKSFLNDRKPEMVNLLQKLVSMPSVGYEIGQEKEAADHLVSILDGYGIRSRLVQDRDAIAVMGSYGYADEGFLLNCPLDTTPAGDVNKWKYPPFGGVIKAGNMYGRGTADAKGGIVAMIFTLLALKEFVAEEDVRVELVFDGGEQDGTYKGMNAVLEKGLYVDAGIIGYANDNFELPIGARGYHRYKLVTKGVSAHTGARKRTGVNAIEKMTDFITSVKKLSLPNKTEEYFDFGNRMTFSMIEGGRAINIVPDTCESKLDVRTIPANKKGDVDNLIQKAINKLSEIDQDFETDVEYLVGNEGYILDKNERIIELAGDVVGDIFGKKPPLIATGPAHIGNLLYQKDVPVIIWGPVGGNVHSYNEYVELDSLPKTAEMYFNLIIKYFSGE